MPASLHGSPIASSQQLNLRHFGEQSSLPGRETSRNPRQTVPSSSAALPEEAVGVHAPPLTRHVEPCTPLGRSRRRCQQQLLGTTVSTPTAPQSPRPRHPPRDDCCRTCLWPKKGTGRRARISGRRPAVMRQGKLLATYLLRVQAGIGTQKRADGKDATRIQASHLTRN